MSTPSLTSSSKAANSHRLLAVIGFATTISLFAYGLTVAKSVAAAQISVAVSGNHLVDGSGKPIRLLGVNRSGTEWECAKGTAVFAGPSNSASIAAIASWHVDAVRVPLNENCWLNINMGSSTMGGSVYQQAIINFVNALSQSSIYAILDLHVAATGSNSLGAPQPMPDADHAPAFWSSVATTFKNNPGVLFDLFNEPNPGTWSCWLNGCTVNNGTAYQAAGMQSLVNAVRATGARQPIMLGGIAQANDMSGWLANLPSDPLNQLVASVHSYNFSKCSTTACFSSGPDSLMRISASHPIVFGELGEIDCAHSYIDQIMPWADANGLSYLGWAWIVSSCASYPALITDYNGTPTPFGVGLRDHLAAVAGQSPPPTPNPAPSPNPTANPIPVSTPVAPPARAHSKPTAIPQPKTPSSSYPIPPLPLPHPISSAIGAIVSTPALQDRDVTLVSVLLIAACLLGLAYLMAVRRRRARTRQGKTGLNGQGVTGPDHNVSEQNGEPRALAGVAPEGKAEDGGQPPTPTRIT